MSTASKMYMNVRVGESIRIGSAVVTLEDRPGRAARLMIEADRSVPITRVEVKSDAELAGRFGITGKAS